MIELLYYPRPTDSSGRALYYEAKRTKPAACWLFYQARSIGRKYFYGNGQQNYAKKLSYSS
jgi:hypothetical protein